MKYGTYRPGRAPRMGTCATPGCHRAVNHELGERYCPACELAAEQEEEAAPIASEEATPDEKEEP